MIYQIKYHLFGRPDTTKIVSVNILKQMPDNVILNEEYSFEDDGFMYEEDGHIFYTTKEFIMSDTRHRDRGTVSENIKKLMRKQIIEDYIKLL